MKNNCSPSSAQNTGRSVSRRRFITQSALAAAGIGILGSPRMAQSVPQGTPMRAIAYNVLECKGWPSDAERALHVVEKGQIAQRFALELSLYDPDIIAFAESPDQSITDEIARLMGLHVTYFPSGGYWPGTLFSRLVIIDSTNVPMVEGSRPEDLFTRHWLKATLRLSRYETRRGDTVLLKGDLNHAPHTAEYEFRMNVGWVDTHTAAGSGAGRTVRVENPTTRIDYVMAYGALTRRIADSRVLFDGAFRTKR